MDKQPKQEVWLRGPLPGISPLLQPAAHAMLQALEEITEYTSSISDRQLWERPATLASIGFHLRHIAGVLDRLYTYADGRQLSDEQLTCLNSEALYKDGVTAKQLVENLSVQVDKSISHLSSIAPDTLTETRYVGRKMIPSTVIGLLFHAAEHMQRHTGQLLATARFLSA